jgi:hypothetical protein
MNFFFYVVGKRLTFELLSLIPGYIEELEKQPDHFFKDIDNIHEYSRTESAPSEVVHSVLDEILDSPSYNSMIDPNEDNIRTHMSAIGARLLICIIDNNAYDMLGIGEIVTKQNVLLGYYKKLLQHNVLLNSYPKEIQVFHTVNEKKIYVGSVILDTENKKITSTVSPDYVDVASALPFTVNEIGLLEICDIFLLAPYILLSVPDGNPKDTVYSYKGYSKDQQSDTLLNIFNVKYKVYGITNILLGL